MNPMTITVKNCQNIRDGKIHLHPNKLNIKYAPNGTGKSTIAKAIQCKIKKTQDLKKLKPFNSADEILPEIEGVDSFKSILIFDSKFQNQFLFQKGDLIKNSFEIFVKTENYEANDNEIKEKIRGLENIYNSHPELETSLKDFESFIDAFGKALIDKTKLSKTSALSKSLVQGNPIANLPSDLNVYSDYINDNSDSGLSWILWQKDGISFNDKSNSCPYCALDKSTQNSIIKTMAEYFDTDSISLLCDFFTVVDKLAGYFSQDTLDNIAAIRKDTEKPSNENIQFLIKLKDESQLFLDSLKKLRNLRSTSLLNLKREDFESELTSLRLDLYSHPALNSPKTTNIITSLNTELDKIIESIRSLNGLIAKQSNHVAATIDGKVKDINSFFSSAGYRYQIKILNDGSTYRTFLSPIDTDHNIENPLDHLSFGEMNAFSIMLFKYQCIKENPDLIILDDPISSFDQHKKYALFNSLFRNENNGLRNRTVLLFTHDMEPIIDACVLKNSDFEFNCSVISNKSGIVDESPLRRDDFSNAIDIYKEVVKGTSSIPIKIQYLRKYFEATSGKNIEWNLLSNLIHRRDIPKNIDETLIPQTDFENGQQSIKEIDTTFCYNSYYQVIANEESLIKVFWDTNNALEKIAIFRILEYKNDRPEVQKLIDQTFHLENDFLWQINPLNFSLIPEYLIDLCSLQVQNRDKI